MLDDRREHDSQASVSGVMKSRKSREILDDTEGIVPSLPIRMEIG